MSMGVDGSNSPPKGQGAAAKATAAGADAAEKARVKEAQDKIAARRVLAAKAAHENSSFWDEKLDGWRPLRTEAGRDAYASWPKRAGLALSGGGIRSATISLGLVEGIASRGRFYAFDLMSTVSGGGYFGSFARSLFVEREDGNGRAENEAVITHRTAFADATLTSVPDQQYFRWRDPADDLKRPPPFVKKGKTVKNPLWWLRENGRYLAPEGMSDYRYAISNIVRNWLTLILLFVAAAMVVFGAIQLSLLGLSWTTQALVPSIAEAILDWLNEKPWRSPMLPVLALMTTVGAGIASGYWLSMPLPFARRLGDEAKPKIPKGTFGVLAVVTLVVAFLVGIAWLFRTGRLPTDPTAQFWALGVSIAAVAALVSLAWSYWRMWLNNRADVRHEQTQGLSRYNGILLAVAIITLFDVAALWLREILADRYDLLSAGLASGGIASVLSFLVAKLPDWVGLDGSKFRKFLLSNTRYAALFAALVIIAAIAVMADVLVIKLLWRDAAWWAAESSVLEWRIFIPVMVVISLFAALMGVSVKSLNVLALTSFYGSRLTRAFLGGANCHRLDTANKNQVIHSLLGDDLSLKHYMTYDTPAPLHLINVTRNRTIGYGLVNPQIDVENDDPLVPETKNDPRGRLASYESSLTLYDRHGDRAVFGPFGARIGADFYNWDELEDAPSLGLLCAISGAAVGPGMGRHGSLGTSMALTLANVRLGYWWKARGKKSSVSLLPGLSSLFHELTGRFSTHGQWYLSDGGHSENSGALSLLERGCGLIVVADNAQDPHYLFGDLEIFIRTARTDVGMDIKVVQHDDFPDSLKEAREHFFNGVEGDWRARAKDPNDAAFALLLTSPSIPTWSGGWQRRNPGNAWIVWLKPKLFADLPADISTYGLLNPDFPQQSTGNQFFDEGQWESYRRLGFEMGRRLFTEREVLKDLLPVIYLDPRPSSEEAKSANESKPAEPTKT